MATRLQAKGHLRARRESNEQSGCPEFTAIRIRMPLASRALTRLPHHAPPKAARNRCTKSPPPPPRPRRQPSHAKIAASSRPAETASAPACSCTPSTPVRISSHPSGVPNVENCSATPLIAAATSCCANLCAGVPPNTPQPHLPVEITCPGSQQPNASTAFCTSRITCDSEKCECVQASIVRMLCTSLPMAPLPLTHGPVYSKLSRYPE